MTDALRDLEAIMTKARDMVRLAQDLNDRLSATASSTTSSSPYSSSLSTEPEEATFIRSSLSQLGLQMTNTPVTLDMIKDERKWEEELVRELADVVQVGGPGKGILRGRGIIGLDEVWGGWNRARGICEHATAPRHSSLSF
jgi:ESCRT-II complex subunit VPS36